jgi:hypothetical protein
MVELVFIKTERKDSRSKVVDDSAAGNYSSTLQGSSDPFVCLPLLSSARNVLEVTFRK